MLAPPLTIGWAAIGFHCAPVTAVAKIVPASGGLNRSNSISGKSIMIVRLSGRGAPQS